MRQKLLTLCFILISFASFSKTDSTVVPQVRSSPTQIANLKTSNEFYIKVTYGQPFKKNRKIFGALVPYGEVWRLGANEATEITVTNDFEINGNFFKAGTYELFAIPNEKEWTMIFNSVLGQWGAFKYDPAFDVSRINIPVNIEETIYEGLTFELIDLNEKEVNLLIKWDQTVIKIPIKMVKKAAPVQESSSKKKKKK